MLFASVVRLNVTINFGAGQQPHLVPFRDIPCKSIDPPSPAGYSLLSTSTQLDDLIVENLAERIYPLPDHTKLLHYGCPTSIHRIRGPPGLLPMI